MSLYDKRARAFAEQARTASTEHERRVAEAQAAEWRRLARRERRQRQDRQEGAR